MTLLGREAFSERVLTRDRGRCVACDDPAVDAHHLIERRLFTEPSEASGYFLDNGVALCARCHLLAEQTDLTVERLREAAGITRVILPAHLEPGQSYDKWGNPVLANGMRLRGELFFDEAVQRVLSGHRDDFTHWVKFPRTYHLPWSPGRTSDDKVLASLSAFEGQRCIATIKRDGENTTLYHDHFHARSLDSRHHPSRDWIKGFWGGIRADIPEFWRICGENLFARHSIAYDDLRSYFEGFHVWSDANVCQSWAQTQTWFELFGITPAEVIYDGPFDLRAIERLSEGLDLTREEGFVLRVEGEIPYAQYRHRVGKFVRESHVMTTSHWMSGPVVRNHIRASS